MLKILVVDDNPVNLKLVEYILRDIHEIHTANNGEEAVSMTEGTRYDLIIMDLFMPFMDGAEATFRIRKSENNKSNHTPIMIYSTSCMDNDKERCMKYGADEYLVKPVRIDMLRNKVEQCFSGIKKENCNCTIERDSIQ